MIVEIPSRAEHMGIHTMTIEIPDECPVCGGPRGVPHRGLSYDGSRRVQVDMWTNPCGHVDKYADVRRAWWEAQQKLENEQKPTEPINTQKPNRVCRR